VGGQAFTGYVTMTNFPRNIEGATVSLSADSNIVQLPATVVVPKGAFSAAFSATASTVSSVKTVTITANFNGTTATTTMDVNPIPTVTITAADYILDTQMFKVKATTSYANSILTFGTDPKLGPIGSMQVESPGVWSGAVVMATAPKNATVWNSNGGSATIAVTVKTGTGGNSTGGGGGATGGGGGGGSTTTYKLSVSTNGKGSVALTCGGATCASPFAAGTVVTLTATPAAGSPWVGWSGACTGTATSCNLTMNKDQSVTANFR
jgi:hypothetical protein